MRLLQADAGNTAVKWRLLDGERELLRGRFLHAELDGSDSLPRVDAALDAVWIASVAPDAVQDDLAEAVFRRYGIRPRFAVTPARGGNLINSYASPQRMGVDRWLAMLGARARTRQRFCLVDAGSALTIDLVAADGQHEGGFILPGFELMERALMSDTGRVRFDGSSEYALEPGRDTRSAVHNGAALALAGAVRLAVTQANGAGAQPLLFVCGGDGPRLVSLLHLNAQLCQDLVFEGLSVYALESEHKQG